MNCKNIKWLIILSLLMLFPLVTYSKTTVKTVNKNIAKKTVKKQSSKAINTLAKIKTEAFKDVKNSVPPSFYQQDLHDKYYKSNMAYIENVNHKTKNEPSRSIFPTYCGSMFVSYGIRYDDKPNYVYFYNSAGKLMRIEIDNNNPATYPKKTITYNNTGKLHTVVYYVSPKEQYNFNGSGILIVHWVGEKAYNREGKLMKITRSL